MLINGNNFENNYSNYYHEETETDLKHGIYQRAKSVEYKSNGNNFNQSKNDSDDKEKIYCDDDGEYRIYSHLCDKLAIDRFHNNHLKSHSLIKNFRKRQQINNTSSKSQLQINHLIL